MLTHNLKPIFEEFTPPFKVGFDESIGYHIKDSQNKLVIRAYEEAGQDLVESLCFILNQVDPKFIPETKTLIK